MKKLLCVLMALCMMLGLTATLAYAINGPSEEQWEDDAFAAYVLFVRVDEYGEVIRTEDYEAHYAFSDNVAKGEMEGAVYDRATNTLTITNLNKPDFMLETNAMGDDFKINVVGECSLSRISVWGWMWGGCVTFTGNGHLTLNEGKNSYPAIMLNPEGSKAEVHFGPDVTADLYSSGDVMRVHLSDSNRAPFYFDNEPAEPLDIEKSPVTDFIPVSISVYKGGETTKSFERLTYASDPGGVYVGLETTWYQDFDAGIIDHTGYSVYRLIYVDSLNAWIFDPTISTDFGQDTFPTQAEFSDEEFEAAGFSVVYDNGYPVWDDYTMAGDFFSSVLYTDGENEYFSYYEWDSEKQESVERFYHITPIEGLENTYYAGEVAEGVTRDDVTMAGEEEVMDGVFTYPVHNNEIHIGTNGLPPFPFKDVKDGKWYTEPIKYVYYHGLMNGMTDTTFEPNADMSRAMLVTVLWRAEGSPAPKGTTPFTDLKAKWYKDAVAWAYENKIVNGMSDTTFAPNNSITREQIAAIFYRFADFKGEDVTGREDISKFPDGSKVSKYAKEAMSWAVAEGLISGTKVDGKDYLDPKGNATRAQVATILMRYLESR